MKFDQMKKITCLLMLLCLSTSAFTQSVPEQFSRELNQISQQYSSDMRNFLKSLPVYTTHFNSQQTQQYCGIVGNYVDQFYTLTQKHRNNLPFSYAHMTKQDVILKVKQSKEMQILKDYNIQCQLD